MLLGPLNEGDETVVMHMYPVRNEALSYRSLLHQLKRGWDYRVM